MPRNNILLPRLPQSRRVQLPSDCIFFAKYQHVGRRLKPNYNLTVRVNRTFVQKITPRRQGICRYGRGNKHRQRLLAGAGIDLLTAIDLGKKAAGSSVGQTTIKDAINALPTAYKKIKSKITNKKARAVLNTGIDD